MHPSFPTSKKPVEKCKALIIDDQNMFREYLGILLKDKLGMSVCGEADNIHDAMRLIHETYPDIVILDIALKGSGGLHLIKSIRAHELPVGILVLSAQDQVVYAERAMSAGANGYITKAASSAELARAISDVLQGGVYATQQVIDKILGRIMSKPNQRYVQGITRLANRELEVFKMLGHGVSTRDIAQSIGLGETTVETYRARIKTKLLLRSSAELYLCAGHWVRDQEEHVISKAQAMARQIPSAR